MGDVCKAGRKIGLHESDTMMKAKHKGIKTLMWILFGAATIFMALRFFVSDVKVKEGLFTLVIAFCIAFIMCFVCKKWFVLKPTREELEKSQF
jgi:hypothetical protein